MNDGAVLLPGMGLDGFRSFHGGLRLLGPLSKITLLAGQNNAGKSNVLGFASRFLSETAAPPDQLDVPRLPGAATYNGPIRLAVARYVTDDDAAVLLSHSGAGSAERAELARLLDAAPMRGGAPSTLISERGVSRRDAGALVWLVYALEDAGGRSASTPRR